MRTLLTIFKNIINSRFVFIISMLTVLFTILLFVYLESKMISPVLSIDQQVMNKLIMNLLFEIELVVCDKPPLTYKEYYTIVLEVIQRNVYIRPLDYYKPDQLLFIHRLMSRVVTLAVEEPEYFPLKALAVGLHVYGTNKPDARYTTLMETMYRLYPNFPADTIIP